MGYAVIDLHTHRWMPSTGAPSRRTLLVHGLASVGQSWWAVAGALAASGHDVTAADLRGHGLSPPGDGYDFEVMASDLVALGSWDIVVGHSLGGPIAAVATRLDPGFAARLVLVDPVFEIDDVDAAVAGQLAELDPDATVESVAAAHPAWSPLDAHYKAVGARTTPRRVVEACLRDNRPWAHLGLLDELEVPTTILGADPSIATLFPPGHAERVRNESVHYRMIEGVGHSIHREDAGRSIIRAIAAG